MTGRIIAEEYTAMFPNESVLFTPGYPENKIVRRGRWNAGTPLLAKPYRAESLAQIVRNALDS